MEAPEQRATICSLARPGRGLPRHHVTVIKIPVRGTVNQSCCMLLMQAQLVFAVLSVLFSICLLSGQSLAFSTALPIQMRQVPCSTGMCASSESAKPKQAVVGKAVALFSVLYIGCSSPFVSAAVFRRDTSNTDPVAQKCGTARPSVSASKPASVYSKINCLRLLEYGAVGFAWRVTKPHRQKYLPWSCQPNFNEMILRESLQTEGFHDTRYFDACKQLGAETLQDLKFADMMMIAFIITLGEIM